MTSILDRQTHSDLETWRKLLDRALRAITAVEQETGTSQQIRIGGGTVLSALWGHRYSRDVDLFTRDPQMLGFMRPYLNDTVASILGNDYAESTNAIKFKVGLGSIDLVAAGDVLPDTRPTTETFAGRMVEIEDPAEILAKKIFHRGTRGTVRDYVDLVEGMRHIPGLAKRLSKPLASKIHGTREVLIQMNPDRFREGMESIRFIGAPPDSTVLRDAALDAITSIINPPGGGGQAAFLAFQRGTGL